MEVNDNKYINKYTAVRDEYNSLVSGVALRDISFKGILEITGKEGLDYLNRISTNSLLNLAPDNIAYTLFTSEKGRIIDRCIVINTGESLLLFCGAENKRKLNSWLNKYIIMEDIKITDANQKYTVLEFIGPQSNSFLISFFGREVSDLIDNEVVRLYFDNYKFSIIKTKDFGVEKIIIFAEYSSSNHLVRSMIANKSAFDLNIAGEDAYKVFRIEKGMPEAPYELNDDYNPYEVGVIKDVSFSKGCYIGQEVIARLDTYDKVQKYLRGFTFNQKVGEGKSFRIFSNNVEVGKVTSYAYSFLLKKMIGLGIIRKDYPGDGTSFIVKDNGNESEITVCNIPFRK